MIELLELAAPLILVALGGLISEKAGVLNIALEGLMLGGAFFTVLVYQLTFLWPLGVVAALLAGGLLAAIGAWGVLKLKSDLFLTGLALNLFIPGLTGWVSQEFWGNQGAVRMSHLPDVMFFFVILALVLPLVILYLLHKTPWGLKLRVCGTSPELAESRGIDSKRIKGIAFIVSGMLAALGGSSLALSLGAYVPGMSAGKGWIALVALYLGLKNPIGILAACLLLAFAEQFAHFLQGLCNLPSGFILAVPSLLTVVVYGLMNAWSRKKQGSQV